jgi:L-2-hydroxyglutarate oxidase LhgO
VTRVDAVVLGAGVVGLACARALALRGRDVYVVEAEGGVGRATSSRNSGVVHAGLYYPRGSWKARLCVEGAAQLYAYAQTAGVPHERTGKWVLAGHERELPALRALERGAQANGAHVAWVEGEDVQRAEPALRARAALWSPGSGVVDVHCLMDSLLRDARAAGAQLVLGQRATSLRRRGGLWELGLDGRQPGPAAASLPQGPSTQEWVQADSVVNACGHGAPQLARLAGVDLGALGLEPQLYRGDYMSLDARAPRPRCALVYPLPQRHGLGVHLTRDLGGRLRAGPDAYAVATADVALSRHDEQAWAEKARAFAHAVRRYLPGVEAEHLAPEFAGVRPKVQRADRAPSDFVLLGPDELGVRGVVHLLGIESPGLTASLALAEWVATRLETRTTDS